MSKVLHKYISNINGANIFQILSLFIIILVQIRGFQLEEGLQMEEQYEENIMITSKIDNYWVKIDNTTIETCLYY